LDLLVSGVKEQEQHSAPGGGSGSQRARIEDMELGIGSARSRQMNVAIANILEFQCIIVITRGRNVENKLAPPAYDNLRKKQKKHPL